MRPRRSPPMTRRSGYRIPIRRPTSASAVATISRRTTISIACSASDPPASVPASVAGNTWSAPGSRPPTGGVEVDHLDRLDLVGRLEPEDLGEERQLRLERAGQRL